MNREQTFRTLIDDHSEHSELISALEAASERLTQVALGPSDQAWYLVGTGYDFSQFSQKVAVGLADPVGGIACLWTEACDIPALEGDRVFACRQEFVEPSAPNIDHTLLLCSSVIADKMEPLTHLIRIAPMVRPRSVVVAAALINVQVRAELSRFLTEYFGRNAEIVCDSETSGDLRQVRSTIAERLDNRRLQVVPIMSEWLLSRRFGPRPEPTRTSSYTG